MKRAAYEINIECIPGECMQRSTAVDAATFEAAREIINCYHITFVKGHFPRTAPASQ